MDPTPVGPRRRHRLAEARKKLNLTQVEAAVRAGVAPATYRNAEMGMAPSEATQRMIARALEAPVDYLFADLVKGDD